MIPLLPQAGGPLLTLSLMSALPGKMVFARASNGWSYDGTGALVQSSTNVARFDYSPSTLLPQGLLIEPPSTNGVRNPRAEGATPGTPGTPPTNWSVTTGTGVAKSIVGTGIENGVYYCDVRFNGTATGTVDLSVNFESNTGTAALSGQTWTGSGFVRLTAGAFGSPSAAPQWLLQEYNNVGAFLAQTAQVLSPAPSNSGLATQRQSVRRTLNQATTANIGLAFYVQYPNAAVIDFTIRLGIPVVEQLPFMSSPIMPPVSSPAASTRAGDGLTMPVSNVPGFQSAAGFGLVLDFNLLAGVADQSGAVPLGVAPASGFVDSWYGTISSSLMQLVKVNGGAGATSGNMTVAAAGVAQRLALSGVPGTFSGSLNGVVPVTASNAGYPAMITIGVMRAPWGLGNQFAGYARRLRLFGRPLTAAQLQRESTP